MSGMSVIGHGAGSPISSREDEWRLGPVHNLSLLLQLGWREQVCRGDLLESLSYFDSSGWKTHHQRIEKQYGGKYLIINII